jgi:ribosome-binding protein aMBF1 (putative translation factor)
MSRLAFRNLNLDPSAPVSAWPTEAVQTCLERGDIADWHRLVVEVQRQPWGRTTRQIEEVLSHSRPYGIAEAIELVIARARQRTEEEERAAVATEIRQAIEVSGLTLTDFASAIGTSASRLSTYARGTVVPAATMLLRIRRLAST